MSIGAPLLCLAVLASTALAAGTKPTILKVPGDSDTIQGAVDMAGPDTIIQVKKGDYAEAVVISGKTDLTLLGKGRPTVAPSTDDAAITVTGGSTGVLIQGFTLEHATVGVELDTCDHVTVRKCRILAMDEDGMRASSASFLVIEKNTVEAPGQFGLDIGEVPGVTDCSITGNTIEDTGSHGLLLGGLHNVARQNTITRPGGDGLQVRSTVTSKNNDVLHNVVKQAGGVGLLCNGSFNLFAKNRVEGSGAEGLRVSSTASGNSFHGNKLAKAATQGIRLTGVANLLDNNKVSGALDHGVLIEGSGSALAGNSASKSGADGFHVAGTGNSFTGNVAKGSAELDLEDEHAVGSNLYAHNVFPDNNLGL